MFISAVAIFLAMVADVADPVEDSRVAYTHCMIKVHNDAVDEQITVSAFRKSAETACEAERLEYHRLLTKSELEFGSTAAEAKAYVDDEIKQIIDSIKSDFGQNRDANAKLIID